MTGDVKRWIEKDGEKFLRSIGMRKRERVLDFGCGEGHYTIPAANIVGMNGKIYALDKDKEPLDRLRRLIKSYKIKNIEILKNDSKTFLKENSLNFVLCYDAIHYLKDRKTIYKEIHRILKPKGVFSLYPKHHKHDHPLMELAHVELKEIIKEIVEVGFSLINKTYKELIHNDSYNYGHIFNFRKGQTSYR